MKELWIEPSEDKKEALSPLVNQFCDVIVEGNKARFLPDNIIVDIVSPKKEDNLDRITLQGKTAFESASAIKKTKTKLLKRQNKEPST